MDLFALDVETPAFFDKVAGWAAEPGVVLTVALCMSDTTVALAGALSIATRMKAEPFPVHVRLDSDQHIGLLLEDAPAINAFGQPSRFCTPDAVENETLDVLARRIHEAFRKRRLAEGANPDRDPALSAWADLDTSLRDSNRQQADHIPIKLRAVGCEMGAPDEARRARRVTAFAGDEVATLARMEHSRLVAERKLGGWKYGPERDVEKKISPHLVAWSALSDQMKATHVHVAESVPEMLEAIGKWVYRV
jgi:hypothetical protein